MLYLCNYNPFVADGKKSNHYIEISYKSIWLVNFSSLPSIDAGKHIDKATFTRLVQEEILNKEFGRIYKSFSPNPFYPKITHVTPSRPYYYTTATLTSGFQVNLAYSGSA